MATLSGEVISGTPDPLGRGGYTRPTLIKKEERDGAKTDYSKKDRCYIRAVRAFGNFGCLCSLWCNSIYRKNGVVMSRNDFLIIGSDVRHCPHCGEVLSFKNGRDFCRKCDEEMHEVATGVNDEAFTFCGLALSR